MRRSILLRAHVAVYLSIEHIILYKQRARVERDDNMTRVLTTATTSPENPLADTRGIPLIRLINFIPYFCCCACPPSGGAVIRRLRLTGLPSINECIHTHTAAIITNDMTAICETSRIFLN